MGCKLRLFQPPAEYVEVDACSRIGAKIMKFSEIATRYKLIRTVQGVMSCAVPEFDPSKYKGLRSGIGRERVSSKHYKCKEKCCATVPRATRERRTHGPRVSDINRLVDKVTK